MLGLAGLFSLSGFFGLTLLFETLLLEAFLFQTLLLELFPLEPFLFGLALFFEALLFLQALLLGQALLFLLLFECLGIGFGSLRVLAVGVFARGVLGCPKFGIERLRFGLPLEHRKEPDEKQRVHGDGRDQPDGQIVAFLIAGLGLSAVFGHQRAPSIFRARPTRSTSAFCSAFITSTTCS